MGKFFQGKEDFMPKASLIICNSECGDWSGLYVNGKLFHEGHSLDEQIWCDLIINYKEFTGTIDCYWFDEDSMIELGDRFPDSFEDIPKEMLKGE